MKKSAAFRAGQEASAAGNWRVSPRDYTAPSKEWADWYRGFDADVKDGNNPHLTEDFRLRDGQLVGGNPL